MNYERVSASIIICDLWFVKCIGSRKGKIVAFRYAASEVSRGVEEHPSSKRLVLCPGDDLILQHFAEIAEIVAVAGHAHDEVPILLRVLLRSAQRGSAHNIELDVVAVQLEIGADQLNELVQASVVGEQLRREFLVEQGAASADVIHLGHRLDHCRRAASVCPLYRRNPFRKRHPGLPSVGGCPDHRSEIHVDRGRQQVDAVGAALGVRASVYGVEVGLEHVHHHVVRVVVVVAVLGRLVQQHLTHPLLPLEIILEDSQQVFHRHGLLVKDVIFDGRQCIGHCTHADPLDVGRVVARAAVVIVLAPGDAVVNQQRKER